MSFRYPKGGFITAFYDPLQVPNAPTIGTATGGDSQASVAFTAPTNVGGSAITSYTAVSSPGGFSASAASSPITVTGLSNGTAYTFRVWALNSYGPSPYSAASGSVTPSVVTIGLISGMANASFTNTNTIEKIILTTLGNSTDFGDLSAATGSTQIGGNSSSTRAIWSSVGGYNNTMEYVTFATAGNTTDWGDQFTQNTSQRAGCGSSTRGLIGGGNSSTSSFQNAIDYFTLASTGNASDFGDLTVARRYLGSGSSPTRGVWIGGGPNDNVMDYVTIATTGNATDFGDFLVPGDGARVATSSTRGIITPGNVEPLQNSLSYITFATTSNTTDFGDLHTAMSYVSATSSAATDRAVYAGGYNGSANVNVIQYTTISTLGNATDFGDLSFAEVYGVSVSNGHGGL